MTDPALTPDLAAIREALTSRPFTDIDCILAEPDPKVELAKYTPDEVVELLRLAWHATTLLAEVEAQARRSCKNCQNRNDDARAMAGLHYCFVLNIAMPDDQFCARFSPKQPTLDGGQEGGQS